MVISALPRVSQSAPDVVYLIVGNGEDRERLEIIAREKGVREERLLPTVWAISFPI